MKFNNGKHRGMHLDICEKGFLLWTVNERKIEGVACISYSSKPSVRFGHMKSKLAVGEKVILEELRRDSLHCQDWQYYVKSCYMFHVSYAQES